MKLDSLLKFFVPNDTSFFPLFEEDARILLKASGLLRNLMASETMEQRETLARQIKEAENEGDELTHKIYQQLNKSFITPFDREDIQSLASALDDVLDHINGASQRINLYKPKVIYPPFVEFAEIIHFAAGELELLLNGLKDAVKNKEKIIQGCISINTLENKADDLYHKGISDLFEHEKDTIELIKNKEISGTLEKAVDKAEDVSDIIKTILIKLA
jgi:predicted phosphate transport protein (TIGR00153 family)